MITETFKSKRAPTYASSFNVGGKHTPILSPVDLAKAYAFKLTSEEYARRDAIVRELYRACPFHYGQVLKPRSKESEKKWGKEFKIKQIYAGYKEFTDADHKDWPKDDVPYILICEVVDPEPKGGKVSVLRCTSDFFEEPNVCSS